MLIHKNRKTTKDPFVMKGDPGDTPVNAVVILDRIQLEESIAGDDIV